MIIWSDDHHTPAKCKAKDLTSRGGWKFFLIRLWTPRSSQYVVMWQEECRVYFKPVILHRAAGEKAVHGPGQGSARFRFESLCWTDRRFRWLNPCLVFCLSSLRLQLFRLNMECTASNIVCSSRDALEGEITFGSLWEENTSREGGICQMRKSLRADSEMPSVSRVAPVTSPISASQRVNLPGVMDAEGRVDESRLRMYIFKNGNIRPVMMCPSVNSLY